MKEKCGNREVMKATHTTSLDNLNPGKGQADFVKFADQVRSHSFVINQLDNKASNSSLIYKSCTKLHRSTMVAWNRSPLSKRNNPNDFGTWLYEEAAAGKNPHDIGKENATPSKSLARSFNTTFRQQERPTRRRKCLICSEDHTISRCPKFLEMDINQRTKYLTENKICFNCFPKGHQSTECRFERNCKTTGCLVKHHCLLHPKNNLTGSTHEHRVMNSSGSHTEKA